MTGSRGDQSRKRILLSFLLDLFFLVYVIWQIDWALQPYSPNHSSYMYTITLLLGICLHCPVYAIGDAYFVSRPYNGIYTSILSTYFKVH